jgi:hypothetical protein
MDWMPWIANKHALLVHLPVAAALLIPVPIIASQRGGVGVRPWWITCRYLAWTGLAGSLFAVVSGLLHHRRPPLQPLSALWNQGHLDMPRLHLAAGMACLALAVACVRALYRRRREHQGIGIIALMLGLAWCLCALVSSYTGRQLHERNPQPQAAAQTAPTTRP